MHTYKLLDKLIKQGFKLFAIADQGYVLDLGKPAQVNSRGQEARKSYYDRFNGDSTRPGRITKEKADVVVYMDNYFTSIPLFHRLRGLGIGACEITRPKTSKDLFPKILRLFEESKNP
jgi:hypothetical protein